MLEQIKFLGASDRLNEIPSFLHSSIVDLVARTQLEVNASIHWHTMKHIPNEKPYNHKGWSFYVLLLFLILMSNSKSTLTSPIR